MNSPPSIQFGTDGVRGPVGEWPLTPEGAEVIGCALGIWAGPNRDVIIGMDTRESGPVLVEALSQGITRGGAHACLAGVLPTAGVSTAIVAHGAAAGAMVTASHNPWTDNGIKVMNSSGRKLEDIESMERLFGEAPSGSLGTCRHIEQPAKSWQQALPQVDLTGVKILLDCAHGSAHQLAPEALEQRGASLVRMGCSPNGKNINDGVGALHPPTPEDVLRADCDFAICLDGDADRVLLVEPSHGLINGDDFLWMLAGDGLTPVVGTIMSNGGLDAALQGRLIRAKVGDRHVAAAMTASSAALGAEPSGHILFSDGMPTGDGLYAALRLLGALPLRADGRPDLSRACQGWNRWDQANRNLRFSGERIDLGALAEVERARSSGAARASPRYLPLQAAGCQLQSLQSCAKLQRCATL